MSGKKVLIVDDELMTCTMLQIALEGTGYAVFMSENGVKGVENAIQTVPDIILSDVMMPEMDGYELCRTLKNHPITSHIPIILLTSLQDSKSTIRGFEVGADDYIVKPFSVSEVLARIERILRWLKPEQEAIAGISGNLAKTSLFDLVNFCEEHRISGCVHVTHNDRMRPAPLQSRGRIYLDLGEITAIELSNDLGEFAPADDLVEALDTLLEWTDGEFVIEREQLHLPGGRGDAHPPQVAEPLTPVPAAEPTAPEESQQALLQFVFQQIRDELEAPDLVAAIFREETLMAADRDVENLSDIGQLVEEYVSTSAGLCYMLQKGVFLNCLMTGTHGILAFYQTHEKITLAISAPAEVNTGLLHLVGRQAVEKIQMILV